MTSVGRWICSTTWATVKVLPLPVIPSSTWDGSPRLRPSTSSLMARGWSPIGLRSGLSANGVGKGRIVYDIVEPKFRPRGYYAILDVKKAELGDLAKLVSRAAVLLAAG